MPIDEQFIQDAICKPSRLTALLKKLGKEWQFDESVDVINQEVSFKAGRIDVLATFNRRTNLVIVEAKAGFAGAEDMRQLQRYLEKWRELPLLDMKLVCTEPPHGLLLAQGFVEIQSTDLNIALVQFKLDRTEPFQIIRPDEARKPPDLAATTPTTKVSGLYSIDDHVEYVKDKETRELFRKVANCFIDDGDPRKSWVVQNPKSAHLAVHYKGIYLLVLWARMKYFYVGYHWNGQYVQRRFPNACPDDISPEELQRQVSQIMAEVDAKMTDVPDDFWGTD